MKRRILFLCTGNSARSQMAEGWLRHLAGDTFDVFSAGTHPVGLNPGAVETMREVDIDLTSHRSKAVTEFAGQLFDYVVTVCDRAKETCPLWPGQTRMVHWSFDDPAAAAGTPENQHQTFRRVRDEIFEAIRRWLESEFNRRI
ncbi:MAG TPA: arsenate reductase ArsC [Nitrospira sp.]|nr:arsenate reductase ArsC [Nitrospira sp.]